VPRAKASFRSVDLANAIKIAKSAGLTISHTHIEPGGKITLVHTTDGLPDGAASPDELLGAWKATRELVQPKRSA